LRISKWVDVGAEVEIEIGLDDVRAAMAEAFENVTQDRLGEPGPNRAEIGMALNQVGTFLKALTDEHIAALSDPARKIVNAFLVEQAKRFQVEGRSD
jgi:hypothetical protein